MTGKQSPGHASEGHIIVGGSCGSGLRAGLLKATSNLDNQAQYLGIRNAILDDDTTKLLVGNSIKVQEVTLEDAVEELQAILEVYFALYHGLESKVFIRKKTRSLWLAMNQIQIDALVLAIKTLRQLMSDKQRLPGPPDNFCGEEPVGTAFDDYKASVLPPPGAKTPPPPPRSEPGAGHMNDG